MMTSKMLCVWRQVHRCKAPNTPFVYIYIILVSLLPFILIFSNYLFCLSTLPLSKCLKGDIVLLSGVKDLRPPSPSPISQPIGDGGVAPEPLTAPYVYIYII